MSSNDVIVCGFPRSGNTWLARLLGDAVDSPVTGWKAAHPLGEEGLDRPGVFVVRQLHLRPSKHDMGEFMPSAYRVCPKYYDGERIVLIVRDPRDVILSVMNYWNRPLDKAINAVIDGKNPVAIHGPIDRFYADWMELDGDLPYHIIRYEDLLADAHVKLGLVLRALRMRPVHSISDVVDRQSFGQRKAGITDDLPYGKGIQNKHLWKGRAGLWTEYYTRAQAYSIHSHLGVHLRRFGYEPNGSWVDLMPEAR